MSELCFPRGALDLLMPMHLVLAPSGTVLHAAPTIAKLLPGEPPVGRHIFEVFELKRPRHVGSAAELAATAGSKLHFQLRGPRPTALKGVIAPLASGGAMLLNLSFGIGVTEAVRDYRLTSTDFAPTDLTVEMLYLVEAKSAAMEESRNLIQRLQQAKIAAEEQAFTDTLTGVKNRRALDYVLRRHAAAGDRFTLMLLDLDWFKAVNDTLGHAAGDYVLQQVARVLTEETRGQDVVARVGGDEFVLVLRDLTEPAQLERLAARIIRRVSRPILFQGERCQVSASIGMAPSDFYEAPNVETMHRDADTALYISKHHGRGCATVVSEAVLGTPLPRDERLDRRGHSA